MSRAILLSNGHENAYLSSDAKTSLFNFNYHRISKFLIRMSEIPSNFSSNLLTASISSENGDLLTNLYLQVRFPKIDCGEGHTHVWCNKLGHAMIESIDLKIGSTVITRLDANCLEFNSMFNIPSTKINTYRKMIGWRPKNDNFLDYAGEYSLNDETKETIIWLPLPFWFTKSIGRSFPLCALADTQSISVHIKLKDSSSLAVVNDSNCTYSVGRLKPTLYGEFAIVETPERVILSNTSHILIEQHQYMRSRTIEGEKNVKINLEFKHPVMHIDWVIILNQDNTENKHEKIIYSDYEIINATINVNNSDIVSAPGDYYHYIQPYNYCSRNSDQAIYTYRFCVDNSRSQPTGYLNFSIFSEKSMTFRFSGDHDKKFAIYFVATNYNQIKIVKGKPSLVFSYSV